VTLKERGLICEGGRAEVIGRPMQYVTTSAFLEYFGLDSLGSLPAADELRRIPAQRPEALLTLEPAAPGAPDAAVPSETAPAEASPAAAPEAPTAPEAA
jgi:segregation and condensation protein B